MKYITITILLVCAQLSLLAQLPDSVWTKTIGGSFDEPEGYGMDFYVKIDINQNEEIFVLSNTSSSDGYVSHNIGSRDCWIIKLNSSGDTLWTKVFGGTGLDAPTDIIALNDGGCILSGYTHSNDYDLTGHHGSTFDEDGFVARLDLDGNIIWSNQYGGSEFIGIPGHDKIYAVFQKENGNIIALGQTNSNNGDLYMDLTMYMAAWTLELDLNGDIIQTKKIVRTGHTEENLCMFNAGFELEDGSGYIFYGESTQLLTADMLWCVKTDTNFNVVWQEEYGSQSHNTPYTACNTSYSYFLISGRVSAQNGDITSTLFGDYDSWIVKIDKATGSIVGQFAYGGSKTDLIYKIDQADSKNFVVAGMSRSTDYYGSGDSITNLDFWVISFDENFDTLWTMKVGGNSIDAANDFAFFDNNIYISGRTRSNENYVHGSNGGSDVWVGKFAGNFNNVEAQNSRCEEVIIFPNPSDGIFTIERKNTKNLSDLISMEIYDIAGNLILKDIMANQISKSVNLKHYSKGIYLLKITTESQIETFKIINR